MVLHSNIRVRVLTFDTQSFGVLLHRCFISQDYGPPQFTEGHSVPEVKRSQSELIDKYSQRLSVNRLIYTFD